MSDSVDQIYQHHFENLYKRFIFKINIVLLSGHNKVSWEDALLFLFFIKFNIFKCKLNIELWSENRFQG